MIGPGLLWFRRFRTDMPMVRLYFLGVDGWLNRPRLPVGALSAGPIAEPASRDERAEVPPPRSDPNPQVFENLRLKLIMAGPRPALRPRITSPGIGLGSRRPYEVGTRPGREGSVAIPGRAVKIVVP